MVDTVFETLIRHTHIISLFYPPRTIKKKPETRNGILKAPTAFSYCTMNASTFMELNGFRQDTLEAISAATCVRKNVQNYHICNTNNKRC